VGNETSLEHCLHEKWGQHNCKHSEDVSVICHSDSKKVIKFKVQLFKGISENVLKYIFKILNDESSKARTRRGKLPLKFSIKCKLQFLT